MAGIYVTEDRLLQLKASSPYFQSPLALFMPRERANDFTSRAKILERQGLKIAVFDDPVLLPRLKRTFPNAEIVIVPIIVRCPISRGLTRPFGHWCRPKRWRLPIPV
jgi:proton glutamate symport protein